VMVAFLRVFGRGWELLCGRVREFARAAGAWKFEDALLVS
jgi:hypothetical protein